MPNGQNRANSETANIHGHLWVTFKPKIAIKKIGQWQNKNMFNFQLLRNCYLEHLRVIQNRKRFQN